MAFELKTSKEYFSMIPLQRYYYFCDVMRHFRDVPREEYGRLKDFVNAVADMEDEEPIIRNYARSLRVRIPGLSAQKRMSL